MAMNRELTEQQALLMQAAPDSPKEQELEKQKDAAAKRLRGSACQKVEITAHDGIHLPGHLHLAEKPKRTIIAVHGWRASWTGRFGLIADFLYENYKACSAPKRLLIVPGAGHCQGYQLEQERYEEKLRRFWQEFDKVDADS
ncbi:MAG: hypothetical protein LUI87_08490 [Lachnospiraceae bacterium]|nr:hypothetical protein [Lachnospiraceae bacterium]